MQWQKIFKISIYANRDNLVLISGGTFAIVENENLMVWDSSLNSSYWGTNLERSSSQHRTVKLLDNENPIGRESVKILWESFASPADTFLHVEVMKNLQ